MDDTAALSGQGLGDLQRSAFERHEHYIRAVPLDKLRSLNIDPYTAAEVVLNAAPRYLLLRSRMATLGPELNLALVDACAPLAHAYCYASQKYVVLRNARPLAAMRAEAVVLRGRLRSTLALLEAAGRVRVLQLSALRRGTSYGALSHDLTSLVRFFDENWEELAGTLAITREDLAQAGVLAKHLLEWKTIRDERERALQTFAQLAHQAFTAFCDAYDEVRRAVFFLRFRVGDAEEIAPSLHGPRKRRVRARDQAKRPEADSAAPSAAPANPSSSAPTDLAE